MFDELRPHLVELRKRLGLSVLAIFIMFFVSFSFHKELLDWVTMPLNNALAHSAELSQKAANGAVTTQQVAGAFFVAIKISFMGAFIGALPFILWQIWLFVAPGLYSSEKKLALPFVLGGTFMFGVGVLFAYYVVTPLGFEFLLLFGAENFTPMINIENYIGFFTHIMIGFGISFELPVAAFLLGALGLITDRTLIDFFRYAVVIIFVAAAILTPPDVLSQLLMAIPLIILYGLSILIVRAVNPAPKEENKNLPVPVND
jgi:sec-independent protein translocase protein TatC